MVAPALRKAYPRLSVLWREDKTEVLVRDLERGILDAAIVAMVDELGDVESSVIADDPFMLVTPKDHPLGAKNTEASATELRGQDVLLLDEGHCFRAQALALCSKARAHELEFRATSLPTLAQMIAAGAGVTLLPRLAVATEVRRSQLKVRAFSDPALKRIIGVVWRKRSPLAPALQQVAATVRDAYPKDS